MKNMSKLCEIDFLALHGAVERAVASYIRICKDTDPNEISGGVLLHRSNRGVEKHTGVGTITQKSELYNDLLSTARRLIEQLVPPLKYHMTSYQNRDPEKGLLGGGLNISCMGKVAMTGLPELANEACLMCGLVQCDLVSDTFVTKALNISDNTALYECIHKGAWR